MFDGENEIVNSETAESATTSPQNSEDTMTLAEVEKKIRKAQTALNRLDEQRSVIQEEFGRLWNRYHELGGEKSANTAKADRIGKKPPAGEADKRGGWIGDRRNFNPIRNLKISAKRAYDWSKQRGRTADEAKQRAFDAAMKSAKKRYRGAAEVQPFLDSNTLPPAILDYIETWFKNYDAPASPTTTTTAGV